jgi:hypothetical protein
MSSGHVISMKSTRLYKYGIWGAAAALVVLVTLMTWHSGASLATQIIPIFILVGFWIYFLRRAGATTVADEVVDCGDHLVIRMGRKQAAVPFANIAGAEIAMSFGIGGVQINFLQPVKLGKQVIFWVESNPAGEMTRVANDITERAGFARSCNGQP